LSREAKSNVLVIGAGLAGLAAAWRLQQQGYEVSVLERSERAGGRVGGEWVDGFCLDRSPQTLHTGDRRILAWIEELGLSDSLLPLRPLQLAQVHAGASSPIDPQSMQGVAAIPGVHIRDSLKLLRWRRLMARYVPLLDPSAPELAAPLDYRSAADFVGLYFGNSCLERWAAPEINESYGGEAVELSRVTALLGWVARDTGRERSVYHGVPRRGLHALVEAAAGRLPIRYSVEVTRVDEAPAGGFTVECRGLSGGRGVLEADAVVLATSAGQAEAIAHLVTSPAERDYLSQVAYRPSVSLTVALDRSPSGLPQLVRVPHCEGLPIDTLLIEPGIAEGRAPMGCGLVTLRATDRFARANVGATDEVVEKGLLASLERLYPAMAGAVRFARLERRASAIPCFDVGAYRALARFRDVQADRRELSRRLYFAGDYLIGPRAEHAVIAGLRAAADITRDAEAAL
jgi:oxygen-dependent protoporphyrinogen oxidase